MWQYPHEQYDATLTGLAVVMPAAPHKTVTADGEPYDPQALAVAHRTLQLPAIARLTNLESGKQILVRVNDRGPDAAGRLTAVTPRVAALLGIPADGVARVRLQVLPVESHAASDDLPGAPHLKIAAAPLEAVRTVSLGGAPLPAPQQLADRSDPPAIPVRLAGTVTQTTPDPGKLFVRLSTFVDRRYAVRQATSVGGGRQTVRATTDGSTAGYVAELGPFATVAEADTALDQAIRAGVTDARIVVE